MSRKITIGVSLDKEVFEYLASRLYEKGRLTGLGLVIAEIIEENKKLREELEKCHGAKN